MLLRNKNHSSTELLLRYNTTRSEPLLLYGTDAAKDVKRGLALATESADEGSGFARFVLGTCYNTGYGDTEDHGVAVRWHRLAAAQGHAVAQCNLGAMFSYMVRV
jgi:TPR repeat protein